MSTPSSTTPGDSLTVTLLSQGGQTVDAIAQKLLAFISEATVSLDFAIYDFRLKEPTATAVKSALAERAAAGVRVRIAYDSDKKTPPRLVDGVSPASQGTDAFVEWLGFPAKPISGLKLMHNKYLIRDASAPSAAVWTGSTNFTDDAWTLQENNIVTMAAADLCAWYARDFEDLWNAGEIGDSGDFQTRIAQVEFAGQPASVQVLFAPGYGQGIDYLVAHRVAAARRRIRLCTMLINAGAFISALTDQLDRGAVPVDGVYDKTQMEDVITQWQEVPSNHWKIPALARIVNDAHLVGKNSTHYSPTSVHDFMHDKVLVIDDTVITGSYNFSRSAEMNAENILFIQSHELAERYSAYIDMLKAKYG